MKRAKFVAMAAAGLIVFSAAALPECAEAAIGGMRTPRVTTPRMNTPRPQTPRTNTPSPAQGAPPLSMVRMPFVDGAAYRTIRRDSLIVHMRKQEKNFLVSKHKMNPLCFWT